MDCERIEALISARVDGEIGEADESELASHLEGCEACRALLEECRAQDRELREAFGDRVRSGDDLRDRLIAAFRAAMIPRRPALRWLPAAAALVIGFALGWAVVVSRSTNDLPVEVGPGESVVDVGPDEAVIDVSPAPVRLAYATGPVELRPSDASEWTVAPVGAPISAGMRVRCAAEALCELHGADGSVVRLDRGAAVRLISPRTWELASGGIGSTVARSDVPFGVHFGDARVTALGTRFDVSRSDQRTQLSVFEGTTRVEAASAVRVVRRGEQAAIGATIDVRTMRREQLALAGSWMNALLVLEGRDSDELARRLDALLAGLGATKMDLMLEKEIRALGTSCVVPLLRYVASPRSHADSRKRRRAARIAADLADAASTAHLIELLSDPDGSVRAEVARALERLHGVDHGLPAARWKSTSWGECEPAYLRWVEWASSRAGTPRG